MRQSLLTPYVKQFKAIEGTEYLAQINEITKDSPYLHPAYPVKDMLGNTSYQQFPNRQQRRAKERKFNNRTSLSNQNIQVIECSVTGKTKYILHNN